MAAAPKAKAGAARKPRKKVNKNITVGQAHIKSTFNNTIISITDPTGAVISWSSSGHVSRPLMPRRWQPRLQLARLRSTV